ncbi:MAG: thermosome subunit alpha [Promethearchaeota archaeon]
MYSNIGGRPLLILKEGTERRTKKDALANNVAAALAVVEAVKSTLGPKGLDKLLVDSVGDLTITNDGATILKEIDVQHPAAKLMVEIARTQDDEIGDGTTTAVVVAGKILESMKELVDSGIHPSLIVSAISKAKAKAMEIIDDASYSLVDSDKETMLKAISTSMNSKMISIGKDRLSELVYKTVLTLKKSGVKNLRKNIDRIRIKKREGGNLVDDTELINGVVISKEIVHSAMPRIVKKPKIAVINFPLEVTKGEWSANVGIHSPEQIEEFLEEEEMMVQQKVQKLIDAGVNVILSSKSMNDAATHFLKEAGILTVKGISKDDISYIAQAVGARVINSPDDISDQDLGSSKIVQERIIGRDKYVFVEGCVDPRAVTILIRGEGDKALDEAERCIHDALCICAVLLENPAVVGGGGAIEVELARRLSDFAKEFPGKEQLIIEEFARAFGVIPLTLAENAGIDALDIIGKIEAAHQEDGNEFMGYNIYTGKIEDMKEAGILEPAALIKSLIKTVSEVVNLIIRIDDMIKATSLSS